MVSCCAVSSVFDAIVSPSRSHVSFTSRDVLLDLFRKRSSGSDLASEEFCNIRSKLSNSAHTCEKRPTAASKDRASASSTTSSGSLSVASSITETKASILPTSLWSNIDESNASDRRAWCSRGIVKAVSRSLSIFESACAGVAIFLSSGCGFSFAWHKTPIWSSKLPSTFQTFENGFSLCSCASTTGTTQHGSMESKLLASCLA
mmetsp:Transcript_116803/g.183675  ORF Transcript_116803/g.183675 Transcript_116803/m.183675 type:complete len:204 (-) Transcript_116803:7-618(-)